LKECLWYSSGMKLKPAYRNVPSGQGGRRGSPPALNHQPLTWEESMAYPESTETCDLCHYPVEAHDPEGVPGSSCRIRCEGCGLYVDDANMAEHLKTDHRSWGLPS
jgi:hypothetical protein